MTLITEKKSFAKAIPLRCTDAAHLKSFLKSCSAEARDWLEANAFAAKPDTFCLVPGKGAAVAFVAVGVARGASRWALAFLPGKLPAGRYALGEGAVAIAPEDAAFAWLLGSYRFTRYLKSRRTTAELQLERNARVDEAVAAAEATMLVRDLVNTPSEHMGPEDLASEARKQATHFGGRYREWVGDQLLKANFPAIHAVGRAADREPRLIEITWGNPKHRRVAVVGKGVCFDSGGLDIKGAEGMRLMKKDMGGAAHALALARLVMQAKLPVYLHMLIPAVENAISGNAYRPGDIVTTRKGVTVEIGNTDAEGRVVLSDALAYAAESNPSLIIDFATLTGAARVALGPELPAMFCNDEAVAAHLVKAAEEVGDPLWRMPLWQGYQRLFDTEIADINNSGRAGFAGCIVAALFLEHFVPDDMAWVHFDTYAWNDISRPGRPQGGEAMGLRAALQLLAG
jgi:leucyl aminopeptidase